MPDWLAVKWMAEINRLSIVKNNMKGTVLDVGCSRGDFHSKIYRKGVYGLDLEDRGNIKKNFVVGDAQKMPFKNKFFDTVVAGELIEHLESPDKFLSEARRVLKDNGILIVSTPNRKSMYNRLTKRYEHEWHKNLFDKKSLIRTIEKYGFNIIEFKTIAYDESSSWGSNKHALKLRRFLNNFLPEGLREDMIVVAVKRSEVK